MIIEMNDKKDMMRKDKKKAKKSLLLPPANENHIITSLE